jgi:hypothetical protein
MPVVDLAFGVLPDKSGKACSLVKDVWPCGGEIVRSAPIETKEALLSIPRNRAETAAAHSLTIG